MANTLTPREVPRGANYGFVDPSDIFRSDMERLLLSQELQRRQNEEERMAREQATREQQRLDQEAKRHAEDIELRKAAGKRAETELGFERAKAAEKMRIPGIMSREAYEAVSQFPETLGDVTVNPAGEFAAEGPLQEGEADLGSYEVPEQITSEGGSGFQEKRLAAEEREALKEREIAGRVAAAKAAEDARNERDAEKRADAMERHRDRLAMERDRLHQNWQVAQLTASFKRDPWVDSRMKEIMTRYDDEMRMYDAQLNAGTIEPDKHAERTTAVMKKREAEVGRLLGNTTQSLPPNPPAPAGGGVAPGTRATIKWGRDKAGNPIPLK